MAIEGLGKLNPVGWTGADGLGSRMNVSEADFLKNWPSFPLFHKEKRGPIAAE